MYEKKIIWAVLRWGCLASYSRVDSSSRSESLVRCFAVAKHSPRHSLASVLLFGGPNGGERAHDAWRAEPQPTAERSRFACVCCGRRWRWSWSSLSVSALAFSGWFWILCVCLGAQMTRFVVRLGACRGRRSLCWYRRRRGRCCCGCRCRRSSSVPVGDRRLNTDVNTRHMIIDVIESYDECIRVYVWNEEWKHKTKTERVDGQRTHTTATKLVYRLTNTKFSWLLMSIKLLLIFWPLAVLN